MAVILDLLPPQTELRGKALLLAVKDVILAEPKRLFMGTWLEEYAWETERKPECGTVGCIAGWTCLLATPTSERLSQIRFCRRPEETAAELLELPEDTLDNLFYTLNWPKDLSDAYRDEPDPNVRVNLAGQAIDRFIKENYVG